jgi:hypothetical protein
MSIEYYIDMGREGYYFSSDDITKIENLKNATFIGSFCTKRLNDEDYNDVPVDVFYQPNPAEGHSQYFGVFRDAFEETIKICSATSCFAEPLIGAVCDDGEVIISRYRHDFVKRKGAMIDGGRAYTRTNGCRLVNVTVVDGLFQFSPITEHRWEIPLVADVENSFIDPEKREWEYDGTGCRVLKGTRIPYAL